MDGGLTARATTRPPAGLALAGGLPARRARLAIVLTLAGLAVLAYAVLLLLRGDPLTAGYTAWQQRELARALASTGAPLVADGDSRAAARAYAAGVERGDPVGRIRIPALELDRVVVHGTDGAELAKGPGHFEQTPVPGLGGTTAIAGHRTTFGAPFRRIDELAPGETIVLEVPYGTFRYVVVEREIVTKDDWTILRDRGPETLVLTACHPLYGSSHRWVVYAERKEAS